MPVYRIDGWNGKVHVSQGVVLNPPWILETTVPPPQAPPGSTDRPFGFLPVGRKVTLRCPDRDCWIDHIDVTSGGGTPKKAPACPNCQGAMAPETEL